MDRILQTLEAMEGLLTAQRVAELLVKHPQTLRLSPALTGNHPYRVA